MSGTRVVRSRRCRRGSGRWASSGRIALGFTLVELLMVIGVIVILISILLPVLNRTREAAASVQCMANLRSIGQAMLTYTNANEGFFAPGRNASDWQVSGTNRQIDPNVATAYWGVFYAVSAKLTKETFACPVILQKGESNDQYANPWCTYGLNGWGDKYGGLSDGEWDAFFRSRDQIALFKKGPGWDDEPIRPPSRRYVNVKFPAQTIFCQDAWESLLDGGHNGDTYASVDASTRGKLTEYAGHDIEYLRHGNNAVSNALFVDGHVEALTKKQQTDERYYTGRWDLKRSY